MSENLAPTGWRERLELLAGRRRESILVAGIVGVLVLGSMATWAREPRPLIAPPARATPSPAISVMTPGGVVVVHVAGAVRHPGVVELPVGSRVADAIERAGGAAPAADLDLLNLAALVVDGAQILVPGRGEAVAPGPLPSAGSSHPETVNLNTADQTMLESVPGLGPVKAQAIIAFRTEVGGFGSIDQLLEVSGIGPATLESIRPFISL